MDWESFFFCVCKGKGGLMSCICRMCFNIGTIIGPVLGGVLADPVGSYPSLFGPGSWMGGDEGVEWMRRWPYALPNFVSAVFLTAAALGVFLGLEEVSH